MRLSLILLVACSACAAAGCRRAESDNNALPAATSDETLAALRVAILGAGTGQDQLPAEETAVPAVTQEEPPADALTEPAASTSAAPAEVTQSGMTREQVLMASLTIFVLAMFVGFELITKVPPTLHTPLMSGSNAISGITIVGAALLAANQVSIWAMIFGLFAVIMATINVIGGFMVTDRMLGMFKRKK